MFELDRRKRPCHCRAFDQADQIAPLHASPPSSRGAILSPQATTSIGAEAGVRGATAMRSQSRCWVKGGSRNLPYSESALPPGTDNQHCTFDFGFVP